MDPRGRRLEGEGGSIAERLGTLHEIAIELSRAEDFDSLCRMAAERGTTRLGFDRIGIWFFDPADPGMMLGSWGTDEEGRPRDERGIRLPRSSRERRDALYARLIPYALIIDDTVYDDRANPVGQADKALAPLWDGTKVIGELVADNLLSRRHMTEEDGEVLALFARVIANFCVIKRGEEALKDALDAKAVLLRELRHRTKNSLALIDGLVGLQASRIADLEAADSFRKLRGRIAVISSLYGRLDAPGGEEVIRLDHYLGKIANELVAGYGAEARKIALRASLEASVVDMARAVPLGLVVNELVTNALKHAFPGGAGGTIAISLARPSDDELVLTVSDDGIGLARGPAAGGKELGLKLVDALCAQVGATLRIGEGPGASFSIRFKA